MMTLSTGGPSTLGEYLKITRAVLGEESRAVNYLLKKVQESPNGEAEEVVADESQMVYLLMRIHMGEAEG